MSNRQFISDNFNTGATKRQQNLMCYDGDIYSYGLHYPLLFTVNGRVYRNVAGYSNTTGRHISESGGFNSIDVKLDSEAIDAVNGKNSEAKEQAILRCLTQELNDIRDVMASKKRKDTKLYEALNNQLNILANNSLTIRGLRGA